MSRRNKQWVSAAIFLAYTAVAVLASILTGGSDEAQGFVFEATGIIAVPLGMGLANWVGPKREWFK